MLTTECSKRRKPSCRDKGWGGVDEGALCLSWLGCDLCAPLDRVATRTRIRPPPCPSSAPCPYITSFGRQHSSGCLFKLSRTFLQIEPCLKQITRIPVGADLSAFAGCSAIPVNL